MNHATSDKRPLGRLMTHDATLRGALRAARPQHGVLNALPIRQRWCCTSNTTMDHTAACT
eukprot:2860773-Alexandrium_andersonii.AAC.1